MLYGRTLLFIHSKCNSLHLPTPNSQFIPLPPPLPPLPLPLGNHKSDLYVCEPVSRSWVLRPIPSWWVVTPGQGPQFLCPLQAGCASLPATPSVPQGPPQVLPCPVPQLTLHLSSQKLLVLSYSPVRQEEIHN